MSALLKAGTAASRALSLDAEPMVPAASAIDPWQAERMALRAEIARLEDRLEAERQAAVDAVEQAQSDGMRAGAAQAEDREDARLAALKRGIDQALARLSDRLDTLDGLAPQLARAAIGKLFDGRESWSDAVAGAVARQIGLLRAEAVMTVHVSPLDFGSEDGFQAMCPGNVQVVLDPRLGTGTCRIECKLGQVDLDLRAQLDALAGLLDSMAAAS